MDMIYFDKLKVKNEKYLQNILLPILMDRRKNIMGSFDFFWYQPFQPVHGVDRRATHHFRLWKLRLRSQTDKSLPLRVRQSWRC